MTHVIAYTNQKGGVTKSTQVINNAVAGIISQKRVRVVDTDSQGNTTYAFGYAPNELQHTVYSLMRGESTLEQTLKRTYYDERTGIFFDPANKALMEALGIQSLAEAKRGPDLLPNNKTAKDADFELASNPAWGTLLRDTLEMIDTEEGACDEWHIDTNPSLGKMTQNTLIASTHVVIPAIGENWAVQGMITLVQELMNMRANNRSLMIAGIVFSRIRYASQREVMKITKEVTIPQINALLENARLKDPRLRKQLEGLSVSCFDTTISEGADVGNATSTRANLLLSHPISPISLEHWQCYIELMRRISGSKIEQSINTYNDLVEHYTLEQEKKEAKRNQKRSVSDGKRS